MRRYRYTGDVGLGEHHKGAELIAEQAELDMVPGTVVAVCGHDDERDLVLVEWTDKQGTPRITSLVPDNFDRHFVLEGSL